VELLAENNIRIKALRDATRGGVSAVLNEWAGQSGVCIKINENKIPVIPEVKGVCEILGFEPYFLACEGTFVMAVEKSEAGKAVEVLKKHELGKDASVIGEADREYQGKVILETAIGTKRILDTPAGVLLPRIC
jgi:hydrogenase expression/formation protein HypE